MTTPEQFRAHFPVLERVAHLASCSLGALSREVVATTAAMHADAQHDPACWPDFEARVDRVRGQVARLLGAHVDQVALVPNASTGAFQVASTLSWRERPRLLATRWEFPSLAHVWHAQAGRGARVELAADADDLVGRLDEQVGLVSVPLVTYERGLRPPVEQVAAAAHAVGARVLVDAYQGLGVAPVDVDALGCDYLVGGMSKYLLGLPGLAFLYVRDVASLGEPVLTGWMGQRDPFAFDVDRLDPAPTARRFEVGTPVVPSCYAASAALDLVATLDLAEVATHVDELLRTAAGRLQEDGHLVTLAPAGSQGAHLAIHCDDPHRVAAALRAHGVVTSPRGRVLRVACHHHTTEGDVDRLVVALRGTTTHHDITTHHGTTTHHDITTHHSLTHHDTPMQHDTSTDRGGRHHVHR